jgi:hypothetical protein
VLTKNGLGYILDDYFTNPSAHPDANSAINTYPCYIWGRTCEQSWLVSTFQASFMHGRNENGLASVLFSNSVCSNNVSKFTSIWSTKKTVIAAEFKLFKLLPYNVKNLFLLFSTKMLQADLTMENN